METATPLRVLVVEDDPASGAILSACIHRAGCTPIGPATSIADALALFHLTTPKAVVIDVGVNGSIDGVAFGQMIRALDPHVPLLFVTDSTDTATFERAQTVRPVAYFHLPCDPITLERTLQLVIQQKEWTTHNSFTPSVPVFDRNGVFVREGGRLVHLSPDTITCVQTEAKYCVIITTSGHRHSVRAPLRELLHHLRPAELARVHRSWLVNIQHIEHINTSEGTIHLTGATQAPLGRAFRDALLHQVRVVE